MRQRVTQSVHGSADHCERAAGTGGVIHCYRLRDGNQIYLNKIANDNDC